MKIFKNKFFIVALSVSVLLTIIISTFSIMGEGDIVKNAVNVALTPFRIVVNKVNESLDGFSIYFENVKKLYEENQRLEKKIESLESEIEAEKGAKEENERLREYLNIKNTHPNFEMLDALVIGRSGDNFITFLTLNRGSGDGVELGMPIIIEKGLVGSVCELGYNWCRVRIISEASSGVGVYLKRSGDIGVLSGIIPNANGKTCIIEYLDENADIEVGDQVYTSGKGSSFPRDLYIGNVVAVEVDKYLRTKVATVECTVNFDELKYVMIITDYTIHNEN